MAIKEIKQARFEALSYGRRPLVKFHTKEIGWFATEDGRLLGVLIFDLSDKDYSIVVLGRDSDKIFKAIRLNTSIETTEEAKKQLIETLEEESKKNDENYHQDELKERFDIYEPKTCEEKQHSHFKTLISSKGYSPAKDLIEEMIYAFKDPDGNYIEQFQTTGFNSRLWELYLFGYFHENDFIVHRDFVSPDFHVERARKYSIEAVTVNPSLKGEIPPSPQNKEEIRVLNESFMPIRFGSSLYTKLRKRYWEKDHVKDNPFIIAIHDFHYDNSMTWSRTALESYIYGIRPKPTFDNWIGPTKLSLLPAN